MIVTIPATSANLGPGFDTLGLAIDLKNEITIKPASITSIKVKGEGARNPKLRADNIFVKIFNEMFYDITKTTETFRFSFDNKIPISRGLGSSSAVIVSALAAAHFLAGVEIEKEDLLNIALKYENHPDNITPAVMGGFNMAMLSQEGKVISRKRDMPKELKAVMVIPNRPTSTSFSRSSLPKKYYTRDIVFNIGRCSFLSYAFFNQDWELLKEASLDKLHQSYRMKAIPELFKVQKCALANGALMSTLSGSGSSFFNLVHESDASMLQDAFLRQFSKFRIEVFDFDNNGVEIAN